MWPKILTYVPPSRGQKRSKSIAGNITGRKDTRPGTKRPSKQYRRRMLPYISADLKWMCLWMALLLGVMLMMTAVDGGAL